ncbi:MAG: hypothetical protein V4639_12965 [Pseudomonadota bacterium]
MKKLLKYEKQIKLRGPEILQFSCQARTPLELAFLARKQPKK